jgi:phosphoglycolate phosphatase-like HAD superfamily hydrolase
MARRAGARSFGVTTGVTALEDWQRQADRQRPDRVLTDLRELLDFVAATGTATSSALDSHFWKNRQEA